MPKSRESFHKTPRKKFHEILEKILRNDNPATKAALAYWRHKHQKAIKELRGEGKKFPLKERLGSYRKIDKGLEPLYNAVRRRNFREIMRQKDEIEAWVERYKQSSLAKNRSPQARRFIMKCIIVNIYYLAIAKTMIALLLDPMK